MWQAGPGGVLLIEAVVATGVLALTCLAISGVISASLRAQGAIEGRSRLEEALIAEAARLETLPYWCAALAQEASPAEPCNSLLGEVFPHADPSLNTAAAAYTVRPGPVETGAFVSLVTRGEVAVCRTATFITVTDEGEAAVSSVALRGWAVSSGAAPPSSTVRIQLEATLQGRTATRCLVLPWLRPSLESIPVSMAQSAPSRQARWEAAHAL